MGPILDMIAVVLENIPATTLVARTTISAVLQTAKIISSIPTVSYHNMASAIRYTVLSIFDLVVKNYLSFEGNSTTCFRLSLKLCFINCSLQCPIQILKHELVHTIFSPWCLCHPFFVLGWSSILNLLKQFQGCHQLV